MGFEIINELKKEKGLTNLQLAKLSGTTLSTIDKITAGINQNPKLDTLKAICKVLGCSLNDFEDSPTVTTFSELEKTHIKKYRTLDKHGKKLVDNVLNLEYERVEATRTPVIPISNVITLSEFEQPVSAGKGVYLGDGSQTITREVPNTEETRKADFILRVSGDSMEPKYFDGDRLLIKRQHDVNIGEEGIFILNNEGFVKRREKDCLVSLNSKYEDILFHDEDSIECKGKVIGKLQIDQTKLVDYSHKMVNSDKQKETVTIGIAARDGSTELEVTPEELKEFVESVRAKRKKTDKKIPDGIL